MHCEKRNRKWACKSRIGAYIRGEIKLEDIMHPSKIIKPKERHNRRSRAFNDTDACRTFLLNSEKIVFHKDIESKIRPYIQGLKSLKDLVHPSKLTNRVISSQAFLELVQRRAGPLQNAIMYDGGDFKMMDHVQESRSAMQPTNFQSLLTILENTARQDAVIRVDDQQNQRYVTVVVSDKPELYADGDRMLNLITKIQNGGVVESAELEIEAESAYLSCLTRYPVRVNTSPAVIHEIDSSEPQITSPDVPSPQIEASNIPEPEHPSNELVTQLYQKIQTLLEERIETLGYNQQQFEKLETLQKENFHLRSTMAKIGEKLNDIEDSVETLSVNRVGVDKEPVSYQEKLRAQNQRLLKTIDSMNSYLVDFENKCVDAEVRRKDAAEVDSDKYKNLYEKEVKNFKRHKRKCEAQHRNLLQRCNQLQQRLQELDDQNLEMAAKLSYVPVKIQLACRRYQDIIKKLNDDLNSLRNLERKSKSSFVHERSYPKNFTWF
ncbi:hypothetical protein V9T40_005109 [Parthenolecanium corni]|uniref:Uncharacterized protein n=1 Tax=Parthenolecanium corni TaxID=536013 RepID=A0AAN9Y2D0_9HEMI